MPLIAGIITDKLGMKLTILIFATLVTIGQLVFVLGACQTHFIAMCIGRFIFGIGSEC
jgi:MFS family permease